MEIIHHMLVTDGKQSNTCEITGVTLSLLWRTMCHLINIVSVKHAIASQKQKFSIKVEFKAIFFLQLMVQQCCIQSCG